MKNYDIREKWFCNTWNKKLKCDFSKPIILWELSHEANNVTEM